MTRYLLHTNAISDLVRNPAGKIAARIAAIGEAAVCTSIIVASELRFGGEKHGSPRLRTQLDQILARLDVLPLDIPADAAYAELRAALERAGTPIGGNDMLIAAQALATSCVVVTANTDEFSRIPGLCVENWLDPAAH